MSNDTSEHFKKERGNMKETYESVRVRFKTDLLSIQNGFIVSTHKNLKSNFLAPELIEAKSPANVVQVVLPPASIRGWLAHGFRAMMISNGISPCATIGAENLGNRLKETKTKYIKELTLGYHHRGSCSTLKNTEEKIVKTIRSAEDGKAKELPALKTKGRTDKGCLFNEVFGAFYKPSTIRTRVVRTTPIKSRRNLDSGLGKGNYRVVNSQATSDADRDPFFTVTSEQLAFVDTVLTIDIHHAPEDRIPVIYGALIKTIEYLHKHRYDYMHQLGGKKNSGAGIIECCIINPLYDEELLRNLLDTTTITTEVATSNEDRYLNTEEREREEVKAKKRGRAAKLDIQWGPKMKECIKAFEEEIEKQKEQFPLEHITSQIKNITQESE